MDMSVMPRNTPCTETFEGLLTVSTLGAWRREVERLIQDLGFDVFLYGSRPVRGSDDYVVVSTYPDAWRDYYDAESLVRHDPTVRHCSVSLLPLVWSAELFRSESERRLYGEAGVYGLRSGISIPMRGVRGETAMISLASESAPADAQRVQIRKLLPAVQLLAAYMQESCARFCAASESGPVPRLTQRELECLKWIAVGKTAWEAAKIMRCSERTINFHVANVNAKLGVSNRRHAATRAISLGLIAL